MRRKDREIKDFHDIVSVVDRCEIVRLAMVDHGRPYIVALNFGYLAGDGTLTLYMHSAAEGRKMDILKENPAVCFEMDCSFQITRDEIPCHWSAEHESVIGSGTIVFITEPTEKKAAMDAIMNHYGFEGVPEYNESTFRHTCLYKLVVDELSGKRNLKN